MDIYTRQTILNQHEWVMHPNPTWTADVGFGDDCLLCPFEPEAEAVEDEVLLRRVACGCFPLNCGVSVDASTAVSSPRILGIAKLIVAIEFFGSSEVLCSSLRFLVSCPVVDDEVCLDQLRPPPDASHGEEVPCVGFITREGVTTQPGAGHGDEDTCAAPEDAGHGEGVTTWQCASHDDEDACVALAITTPEDAEGEYGGCGSDIFLTRRRNGYGYYLDTLKHWVLTKLGLTNFGNDIPLEWSWVNIMGAPIYQSIHHSLGARGDGSCVICSCMTCIHAQHRLAFERRHGAGSFPYELCSTTGVLRFKFLCLLAGVWKPVLGGEPSRVLQMMKMNPSVGLELRDIPNRYLGVRNYTSINRKDINPGKAMILLRLGGPMIGSLHVADHYFISNFLPDYVYRGVPGGVANHAVVCVDYKFVPKGHGELHILVLDNHTKDGPFRWILFEAFECFTCIQVDPLKPKELPRPRTSRLRNLFSRLRNLFFFWK
ncbi:uncharacterized protein [Lolium perenne]|uniref:uncharacterized protein n=1 Tax=Lolium perenne TaxID=4522 RepID=UPI003A994673